jgi:DUF3102 family protein
MATTTPSISKSERESLQRLVRPSTDITTTDPVLAEHVAAIRQLGKRVVADVVEIGRRLSECKRICGHGNWLPWLDREFGWTEKTAERFMSVHALAGKSDNLSNLDLPISGLYLLAAPSTPKEARDAIIERVQGGEPVSVAEVKQTIDAAKGRKQRAKKKARVTKPVAKPVAKPTMAATTTAAKGRKQQARKGWSPERWRRHKEKKKGKPKIPGASPSVPEQKAAQERQDIGPASTGEVERLRARVDELQAEKRQLEIRVSGLESEVEELKAENAELRVKLGLATGTPAGAPPKNGGRAATSPKRCDGSDLGQSATAYLDPGPIPTVLRRVP